MPVVWFPDGGGYTMPSYGLHTRQAARAVAIARCWEEFNKTHDTR